MPLDVLACGAFVLAATALLGSPGPGIAALVAVGRARGFLGGLRYYAGLQVGLALAAGIAAAGIASVLQALPAAMAAMTINATMYLVYLACRIATSPVGSARKEGVPSTSAMAGLLLGVVNPKAFVAFASLFASQAIVRSSPREDIMVKWTLCVIVMIVVDFAWLLAGVALHRSTLRPEVERALNLFLAAAIVAAAVLALA
ncbi:LysE family translocator [Luteimonas salinilitoris]|uniref:LysE family translocator n=1 Tax=Luteimonas salinilitoris TaxID=3237697 RepID=A0ABV4HT52_9GAMM